MEEVDLEVLVEYKASDLLNPVPVRKAKIRQEREEHLQAQRYAVGREDEEKQVTEERQRADLEAARRAKEEKVQVQKQRREKRKARGRLRGGQEKKGNLSKELKKKYTALKPELEQLGVQMSSN